MRISHETRIKDINPKNGYGYATTRMIESLNRLGYEISQNDPDADVQMWFDQPHHWKFDKNKYKIGYLPWESTKLLPGWVDIMNQCDEIWTPSPLIADWFEKDGVDVPIYVYQHGVDKIWSPKDRKIEDGRIKFLHCGFEAARKGNDMVVQAFREAFVHDDNVTLTLKQINPGMNFQRSGKINDLNVSLSLEELVDLYHEHHVYVYPSWGEGFGLTPLQALSTGMPTVTVPDWAPYRHYLNSNLNIKAELHRSKGEWRHIHPGDMFRPDRDDLIDRMRYAVDNYEEVQDFAHAQIEHIREKYDWDTITEETFSALEARI